MPGSGEEGTVRPRWFSHLATWATSASPEVVKTRIPGSHPRTADSPGIGRTPEWLHCEQVPRQCCWSGDHTPKTTALEKSCWEADTL